MLKTALDYNYSIYRRDAENSFRLLLLYIPEGCWKQIDVNNSTRGMLETALDANYSIGGMLETTLNANYSTTGC